MTYILALETAVPEHKHKQIEISNFIKSFYPENFQDKVEKIYLKSGIETRHSVIPDYSHEAKREFYPDTQDLEPFPDINKRMKVYSEKALDLSLKVINKTLENFDKNKITHLITVSCTGMYAPGLDIQIVESLELKDNISRTSVNFMGCYAAFHGLKQADYICNADKNAVVLVVCVELCTLHFVKDFDMNSVTSNALFADGAAGVLLSNKEELIKQKNYPKINKFYSKLLLSGKKDMAWRITPTAFKMVLTEAVPALLKTHSKEIIAEALKEYQLKLEDITTWAIHPGGRRILEYFESEMNLNDNELVSSYKVLKNYGNMSSPTILFVLKEILSNPENNNDEKKIFCAAFGPGLTVETMYISQ